MKMEQALQGPFSQRMVMLLAAITAVAGGLLFMLLATRISPLIACGGIAGIFFSVMIIREPRWGFLLTAAMIPLERFGRFTSDSSNFTISIMRIVGMLTLAGFVLHFITRRRRLKLDSTLLIYCCYATLTLISIFYTSDFAGTVRANGMIFGNILFFLLAINLATEFKLVRHGMALWLILTTVICAYTIYDWTQGSVRLTDDTIGLRATRWSTVWLDSSEWEAHLDNIPRAVGSSSHPAVYGINLVMTLPFFVYFARRSRKRWQVAALLGAMGLVLYNVLLTNTRAVMLIAIVTLGLCWLLKMYRIRMSAVVALVLLSVAALPFVDMGRFDRILDMRNYTFSESRTLQIRTMYWKAGLGLLEDHWLLGIGVGNKNEIPKYIQGRAPEQTTVHNEFLMTMIEVGITGWVVYFTFIGVLIYYCVYASRIFRQKGMEDEFIFTRATLVVMITVLLYGVQCDVFRFPLKGWWYCAGIAPMLFGMAREAAKRESITLSQSPVALKETV